MVLEYVDQTPSYSFGWIWAKVLDGDMIYLKKIATWWAVDDLPPR